MNLLYSFYKLVYLLVLVIDVIVLYLPGVIFLGVILRYEENDSYRRYNKLMKGDLIAKMVVLRLQNVAER